MELSSVSTETLLEMVFSFSSGKRKKPVAKQLLHAFGSINALLRAEPSLLGKQVGIGEKKKYRLKAFVELRRRGDQEALNNRNLFSQPELLQHYVKQTLQDEERELFLVVLLDPYHKIIHAKPLFYGSLMRVAVYPREILRYALLHQAAALVVAHNHPKGEPQPSEEDFEITFAINEVSELLEIYLLDHIIVGEHRMLSFSEQGWFQDPPYPYAKPGSASL